MNRASIKVTGISIRSLALMNKFNRLKEEENLNYRLNDNGSTKNGQAHKREKEL
jgi:hypothetical protein